MAIKTLNADQIKTFYQQAGKTATQADINTWLNKPESALRTGLASAPAPAAQAPGATPSNATQVVAGQAQGAGQTSVTDYAGQAVVDPSIGMAKDNPATAGTNESTYLTDQAKASQMTGTEAGTNINSQDPKYQVDNDALKQTA